MLEKFINDRNIISYVRQAKKALTEVKEFQRNLIVIVTFFREDEDNFDYISRFDDAILHFLMVYAAIEMFRKDNQIVSRSFCRKFRRLERDFQESFGIFSRGRFLEQTREDNPELAECWWFSADLESEKKSRPDSAMEPQKSDDCPDEELVISFAFGEREYEDHFRLGMHIRDCAYCRQLAEDILAAEKEAEEVRKKEGTPPLPEWLTKAIGSTS